MSSTILTLLSLLLHFSNASDQNSTAIDQSLKSLKSALYAVNAISNGTSTSGCQIKNLTTTLNAQGYDGHLTQLLLCECASGVTVFPNLYLVDVSLAGGDE